MKIKSLAIAATAVLTAGAAQAADLNKPAKVAVDYVKVCDQYNGLGGNGGGFFYIPGTDTCINISGYARETWIVGSTSAIENPNASAVFASQGGAYLGTLGGGTAGTTLGRTRNAFVSQTEIEVDVDTRTQTEFGLLRSYESIESDYNSGGPSSINLNRGFVQWGGLTAGRIESNFTFFQGYNDELVFSELGPDYQTNAVSYTFSFGNGVTALIGVEDSANVNRIGGITTPAASAGSFTYQGNKVPDVVAYLNVTQAWGAAQISAALHNVYGTNATVAAGTAAVVGPPATAATAAAIGAANTVNVNKWGYALLAGVWFNLPSLGAGDKIGFQGVYSQGAINYTSAGEILTKLSFTDIGTDASVAGTAAKLNTAWNLYASFVHNFSPAWSLAVGGGVQGYNGYDGLFSAGTKIGYTEGEVGATLGWTPAKNLIINADLEYANTTFTSATKAVYNGAAAQTLIGNTNGLGLKNGDSVIFGLRVKRQF